MGYFEKHLEGRTWVAENGKLSLGDITVGATLVIGLNMIIDEMRASYSLVMAWFKRLVAVELATHSPGPTRSGRV